MILNILLLQSSLILLIDIKTSRSSAKIECPDVILLLNNLYEAI